MAISSDINYLPLYDKLFEKSHDSFLDIFPKKIKEIFQHNNSLENFDHISKLEDQKNVDFSLKTMNLTKRKILFFIKNFIFFPYGIYNLIKFSFQRLIMLPLFPMQNFFMKRSFFNPISLEKELNNNILHLKENGFFTKKITLEKNGIKYSGILIAHKDTIKNGKWVLQATGNCEPIETSCFEYANLYQERNANLIMVNGPGASKSEGFSNAETISDAQEVAISFLETAIKAKDITLAGRSLGGAAISGAILKHEFKKDCKYKVIRQMTFDSVSNICGKITGVFEKLVKLLVKWTDLEIDSVEASKKLQKENISEIIVQAVHKKKLINSSKTTLDDFADDGVIPAKASLGYALLKNNITQGKTFFSLIVPSPGCNIHCDWQSVELASRKI